MRCAKRPPVLSHGLYVLVKWTVYQDRLGTITGEVDKQGRFVEGYSVFLDSQTIIDAVRKRLFLACLRCHSVLKMMEICQDRLGTKSKVGNEELKQKRRLFSWKNTGEKLRRRGAVCGVYDWWVRKTASSFFECFPYVCPKPVLAKWSFLCTNGSKRPFLLTDNKIGKFVPVKRA